MEQTITPVTVLTSFALIFIGLGVGIFLAALMRGNDQRPPRYSEYDKPTRSSPDQPALFRSSRYFHVANQGWYIKLRGDEGTHGPFTTIEERNSWLRQYLDQNGQNREAAA